MRMIYKYAVDVGKALQTIRAPRGWEPLSVHAQRGMVCLWAIVDPGAPMADHRVAVVGTGHEMPAHLYEVQPDGSEFWFQGTVQLGGLVRHVFAESGCPECVPGSWGEKADPRRMDS